VIGAPPVKKPTGGDGVCRLIWGPGRSFPDRAAGVATPSPPPSPPPVETPSGTAAFFTPGAFTWTVPAGVRNVSVACVGAGGGAGTYSTAMGSGGGSGGGGEQGGTQTLSQQLCVFNQQLGQQPDS
jgi:hypothetical protein